jgi:hypothetical protein
MQSGVAGLGEALSRLDQDIADAERRLADAERRLAELRAMRASVQPFIDRYVDAAQTEVQADEPAPARPVSFIDEVTRVFEDHPGEVLEVDDALAYVQETTPNASRDSVRNAINYAVRQGKVLRDSKRRGRYIWNGLRDTSTPAATGVDVNEESDSEGSSGEIGDGRDDTSAPPRDQVGGAHDAQFHLGRAGDRAPMRG